MPINVAKLTEQYIALHPNIKQCLRRGLINYSSLAREISQFYGHGKVDAAFAACRRYAERLSQEETSQESTDTTQAPLNVDVVNNITLLQMVRPTGEVDSRFLADWIASHRNQDILRIVELDGAISVYWKGVYSSYLGNPIQKFVEKSSSQLCQIRISSAEGALPLHQLLSQMLGELFLSNIPVVEQVTRADEVILLIRESDRVQATEILSHHRSSEAI